MPDDDQLKELNRQRLARAALLRESRTLIESSRSVTAASVDLLARIRAADVGAEPGHGTLRDERPSRRSPNDTTIAMSDEHEVQYWTQAFGVTRERLQAAVDAVGSSVAKVEAHLRTDTLEP